jgi:hypothetical protein
LASASTISERQAAAHYEHTMPHLVILYTANLDCDTDMSALCRTLADTMLTPC